MKRNWKSTDPRRLEAAANWFVRLQNEDLIGGDLLEWEKWLASAANKRAFAVVEKLWDGTTTLRHPGLPIQEEVDQDDYDGSVPIADWTSSRITHSWYRQPVRDLALVLKRRSLAAAGGIALFVVTVLLASSLFLVPGPETVRIYETQAAEHKQIHLPDGSSILLGARSSLSSSYTDARRTVVFERGEALFDVASEKNRPFVVVAGNGTITAIGTAFNVRRDDSRVVVTVTDGTVEVASRAIRETSIVDTGEASYIDAVITLENGHRISYDVEGALGQVESIDTETATAWRNGRLRYRAEPLKYVIPNVNRYSRRQIIIADPSIKELVFTGTVFQDQVDEWLRGLEAAFPVEVVETRGDTVLLEAKPNEEPGTSDSPTVD